VLSSASGSSVLQILGGLCRIGQADQFIGGLVGAAAHAAAAFDAD
jgi:hypothetical protein